LVILQFLILNELSRFIGKFIPDFKRSVRSGNRPDCRLQNEMALGIMPRILIID